MTDLAGVLLLWDIDGTLVLHAPSSRDRHAHAVATVTGEIVTPIEAGTGKTDRQIMMELFGTHQPDDDEISRAFAVIDSVTEQDLAQSPSISLPGVVNVLRILAARGVVHSVLTGNSPKRAELKLRSAGLANFFDLSSGFFGDKHENRLQLVASAASSMAHRERQPIIVGDTPLDIIAAQASVVPVIGVASGTFSREQLAQLGPDAIVENLDSEAMPFIAQVERIATSFGSD